MSQEQVMQPLFGGISDQDINELEELHLDHKMETAEENVARFSLLGNHISKLFALKSHSLHAAAEIKARQNNKLKEEN